MYGLIAKLTAAPSKRDELIANSQGGHEGHARVLQLHLGQRLGE